MRALILLAIGMAVVGGVIGVSYGLSAGAGPGNSFDFSALPTVTLAPSDEAAVKAIVNPGAPQFGITDASYTDIRQLGTTSIGPLYVLQGSGGFCVVLYITAADGAPAVSCGEWSTASRAPVSVLGTDDATGFITGGGAVGRDVRRVQLNLKGGRSVAAPRVTAGFIVSPGQRIAASELEAVSADQ